MTKQSGFTLIELVAVLVILAILAVTAVPQFVDLRVGARNASAAGVGGGISSGTSLNYARGVAQGGALTVTGCTAANLGPMIIGATVAGANITVGGQTYAIAGTAGPVASGVALACTITHSAAGSTAQTFGGIGCANATCS